MAWSSTQLSTAIQNAYKNDKPILFGHNILEATTDSGWRTWTESYNYDYVTQRADTYTPTRTATYNSTTKVVTLTTGLFQLTFAAGEKIRISSGSYLDMVGTIISVDASGSYLTLDTAGFLNSAGAGPPGDITTPFEWIRYEPPGTYTTVYGYPTLAYTSLSVTPEFSTTSYSYDAANASYPVYRVWDNHTYYQTRAALPSALTDTDRWSLVFKFPAAAFDSIAILNHNLGTQSNFYGYNNDPLKPDFDVCAYIADDDNFATNVRKVQTWRNPSSDRPLVAFNLSHGGTDFLQYSGVTNVQLSIVCATAAMGTGTGQPAIGELLFGKRVQLRHQAKVPYTDNNLYADAITEAPDTGQLRRYARSSGGIKFSNNYTIAADHADVVAWFESHISYGIKHFLYVPRPSQAVGTNPELGALTLANCPLESYWVALENDSFSLTPVDGPLGFELELNMREVMPYISRTT